MSHVTGRQVLSKTTEQATGSKGAGVGRGAPPSTLGGCDPDWRLMVEMAGGCREGQREVMERLRGSGPERQDSQNHLLDISCTSGSPSLPCGGFPKNPFPF